MKCHDLQLNLSLYFDDVLSADERGILDEHLVHCPLCRQTLVDFQGLRNGLRAIERPEMPADFLMALRTTVAIQLSPGTAIPGFTMIGDRRNWIDVWLMPYSVGAFVTLILGFTMLWVMLSDTFVPSTPDISKRSGSNVLLTRVEPNGMDLTASEYANSRLAFAGESPSINPRGALIALTKSLVRGKMRDDEVVVVADVFGNGLARIAEVVEPSHDLQAIAQLQKALESDPAFAPFVPADLDQRSETIRVVLKIQNVNVSTRQRSDRR